MEVQPPSATSDQTSSLGAPLAIAARQALVFGATLATLLCLMIAIKGLLGAFRTPAATLILVLAAVGAEACATLYRFFWKVLHRSALRANAEMLRVILPTVAILCVGFALSTAGASTWAIGTVWIVIVTAELAWWIADSRISRTLHTARDGSLRPDRRNGRQPEDENLLADDDGELDARVVQQLTRFRDDGGMELISGVLRGEFAAGERTHNLHVAFCPPLDYEPQVIAHQLDGAPVIVKVAQVEEFGARIELQLTGKIDASEPPTIYFEVKPH